MGFETVKVFGEKDEKKPVQTNDLISTLQFSPDGSFLISGDFSGRVVAFHYSKQNLIEFVTQVHAHKSEFDYLRSELSDPRVCAIRFIPKTSQNPTFLTTNMHETKLWSLTHHPQPKWNDCNLDVSLDSLTLPSLASYSIKYELDHLNTYISIDTEFVVSIETLYDQSSFVMVDVGCVKLWDMEREVKPVTSFIMESQKVELTSSSVSSSLPYAVLLGDDQGVVRMIDLRQQSSNLTPSVMNTRPALGNVMEGTQFISSVNFMRDGVRFVARNFGSAVAYDLRQPERPIGKVDIQDYPGVMEGIVENGYNRDSFSSAVMADGRVACGKYGNEYVVWDIDKNESTNVVAGATKIDVGDFSKRIGAVEAHPTEKVLAVAASASLYFQVDK